MNAKLLLDKRGIVESLVGFVDLLGFGETARLAKTADELQVLYRKLATIRRAFQFRPSNQFDKDVHKIVGQRVLLFSDCVVFSVAARSFYGRLAGKFELFRDAFRSIAYAQYSCVRQGNFVRGGVDVGLWYYKHNFLIRPALARAYELERTAHAPVIAITDALHEFMSCHPDRRRYSRDPMTYYFKTYTAPSGKSIHYLNYMAILIEDFLEDGLDEIPLSELIRLEDHASAIRKGHANAPMGGPKAKYEWLADYHNGVVNSYAKGWHPKRSYGRSGRGLDLLVTFKSDAPSAGVAERDTGG